MPANETNKNPNAPHPEEGSSGKSPRAEAAARGDAIVSRIVAELEELERRGSTSDFSWSIAPSIIAWIKNLSRMWREKELTRKQAETLLNAYFKTAAAIPGQHHGGNLEYFTEMFLFSGLAYETAPTPSFARSVAEALGKRLTRNIDEELSMFKNLNEDEIRWSSRSALQSLYHVVGPLSGKCPRPLKYKRFFADNVRPFGFYGDASFLDASRDRMLPIDFEKVSRFRKEILARVENGDLDGAAKMLSDNRNETKNKNASKERPWYFHFGDAVMPGEDFSRVFGAFLDAGHMEGLLETMLSPSSDSEQFTAALDAFRERIDELAEQREKQPDEWTGKILEFCGFLIPSHGTYERPKRLIPEGPNSEKITEALNESVNRMLVKRPDVMLEYSLLGSIWAGEESRKRAPALLEKLSEEFYKTGGGAELLSLSMFIFQASMIFNNLIPGVATSLPNVQNPTGRSKWAADKALVKIYRKSQDELFSASSSGNLLIFEQFGEHLNGPGAKGARLAFHSLFFEFSKRIASGEASVLGNFPSNLGIFSNMEWCEKFFDLAEKLSLQDINRPYDRTPMKDFFVSFSGAMNRFLDDAVKDDVERVMTSTPSLVFLLEESEKYGVSQETVNSRIAALFGDEAGGDGDIPAL